MRRGGMKNEQVFRTKVWIWSNVMEVVDVGKRLNVDKVVNTRSMQQKRPISEGKGLKDGSSGIWSGRGEMMQKAETRWMQGV